MPIIFFDIETISNGYSIKEEEYKKYCTVALIVFIILYPDGKQKKIIFALDTIKIPADKKYEGYKLNIFEQDNSETKDVDMCNQFYEVVNSFKEGCFLVGFNSSLTKQYVSNTTSCNATKRNKTPFDLTVIYHRLTAVNKKYIKQVNSVKLNKEIRFSGYSFFGKRCYALDMSKILLEMNIIDKSNLLHYFTDKLDGWVKYYYCQKGEKKIDPLKMTDEQKRELENLQKSKFSTDKTKIKKAENEVKLLQRELSGQVEENTAIGYCCKDVEILIWFWNQLGYLSYISTLIEYWNLPLSYILFERQMKWQAVYLQSNGFDVPSKHNQTAIKAVGGNVSEPIIGFHEDLYIFDYASLYPSIMIQFNISPDTFIKAVPQSYYGTNEESKKILIKEGYYVCNCEFIDGSKYWVCYDSENKGLISSLNDKMFQGRMKIRKEQKSVDKNSSKFYELEGKQLALKLCMNSTYGNNNSKYAGYYNKFVGGSITGEARNARFFMLKVLTEELKLSLTGGDTDSAFIKHKYSPSDIDIVEKYLKYRLKSQYEANLFNKSQLSITNEGFERYMFCGRSKKLYIKISKNGLITMKGFKKSEYSPELANIIVEGVKIIMEGKGSKESITTVWDMLEKAFINNLRFAIKNNGLGTTKDVIKILKQDPSYSDKEVIYFHKYFKCYEDYNDKGQLKWYCNMYPIVDLISQASKVKHNIESTREEKEKYEQPRAIESSILYKDYSLFYCSWFYEANLTLYLLHVTNYCIAVFRFYSRCTH